jgi:hypothetical protein
MGVLPATRKLGISWFGSELATTRPLYSFGADLLYQTDRIYGLSSSVKSLEAGSAFALHGTSRFTRESLIVAIECGLDGMGLSPWRSTWSIPGCDRQGVLQVRFHGQ